MPNYKIVDADQLDADLKVVADSIRAKGGTSENLSFPNGMAEAVTNMAGGGGTQKTEFLPETTFTNTYDSGFKAFIAVIPTSQEIVDSWVANRNEVTVVYDGETYKVTPQVLADAFGDEGVCVGNLSAFGGTGNGEPFAILSTVVDGTPCFLVGSTVDTEETEHTVAIYQETVGSSDSRVKYVFFKNEDETELHDQPVISGDTARDPVAKGYIDKPTKEPTASTVYTQNGWSRTNGGSADSTALQNVTEDRVVYAAFAESARMYTVNFYDGETLVHTEQVAYGGSSSYEYGKEDYIFAGWSPAPTNITGDLDCYAQWIEGVSSLEYTSWETISQISELGLAENYWAVGDTKPVYIKGTVGTLDLDATYYVYILGFNHNSRVEGNGIHFGTFKSAASNGIDLCLVDSKYQSANTSGTKYFNMNHWGDSNNGSNNGGWAGCDMRYDILGSTDKAPSGYGASPASGRTGYDPSATCATTPVAGTLMAALPADLRAVMKPMRKYTNNTGASGETEAKVTVTNDYLPLLAAFEIFGTEAYANKYEQNKQKQYDYFAAGNSKKKYRHSSTDSGASWWERSAYYGNSSGFCVVSSSGAASTSASLPSGVAPIFKV